MASEWSECHFRDLLSEPVRNGIYKSKEFHGTGAKIINMGELFANPRLRSIEMRRIDVTPDELKRFTVQSGDLLFARRSLVAEGAGRCSLVLDANEPTVFESSIIRARVDATKSKAEFLFYLFSSPKGAYYLDTIRRHVAVAGITGSDLMNLAISIPDVTNQIEIAQVLSSFDDKIELNRKMNETLEAMARALFKSWFVSFDPVRAKAEGRSIGLPAHIAGLFPNAFVGSPFGLVPLGWNITTWGTVATLEYGKSLSDYNTETGMYPVYGTNGRIGTCSKPLCPYPGVIIGRKGAYRGVHYSPSPFFAIDTAFYVAPKIPIELRWAYYELLRLDINSMDSGSAIPSTSREDFYSLPVVVPPHTVQRQFTRLMEPIWHQQEQNQQASTVLASLRDTLLPKLISGELRVPRIDGDSQERE